MKCELKLLSSLEKTFFDKFSQLPEHKKGSMLKNEIYSFQLAMWGEHEWLTRQTCRLKIESELKPYIEVKQIGYVPSILPANKYTADDDYITKKPGLFPDPLYTVKNGEVTIFNHQARALWITVEPHGMKTGIYPIRLKIYGKEELLAEKCFTLEIIDALLPELDMKNTCWFYGDCIAKLHKVEILSDEYFSIVEKYIQVYVRFGHNMILTPIFTPPLDTAIGGERPTNQLVDIIIQNGKYSFCFGKLKRWIDLCHMYGIKYFEISHLFTQWGAYHAPKIMATVEGEYRRIFGWETDALSPEYIEFLHTFLPALKQFLCEEGIEQNCYFHVSDEPSEEHEQQYKSVKEILLAHVGDSHLIDALSAYSFYEKGIVLKPIVSSDHIHTFIEHDVNGLWAYYCCAQGRDVANRFMAMPSYRNRILGYQLYKYNIEGFLHWGYNFWFTQFSLDVQNPYEDTTAGGGFPSGDSFVVYPMDKDGNVVCSLRLYVFHEGLQDMRALKLLESLIGRGEVVAMLEDIDGFRSYPRDSQYILNLRELVNAKIKKMTKRCESMQGDL